MLSFLPGQMLAEAAAEARTANTTDALFAAVGSAVGGVTESLRSFAHPAAVSSLIYVSSVFSLVSYLA